MTSKNANFVTVFEKTQKYFLYILQNKIFEVMFKHCVCP